MSSNSKVLDELLARELNTPSPSYKGLTHRQKATDSE